MSGAKAALLALAIAGCTAVPEPDPVPPAPVAAPAAAVIAAPAMPAEPVRSDFTLTGAFEQGGWLRGRAPSNTASAMLGNTPLVLAQDGSFFAAFDRDSPRSLRLIAQLADGRTVARDIPVTPRDWNIEHVNVARSPGGATEAFMAIRRPELAAIAAARAAESDTGGWKQKFIWPVTGRISGRFGSQRIYRGEPGSYHSGIDVTSGTSGTPYVSPADGVVVLAADDFSLEGKLLVIDHGQGLNSAFLHSSRLYVKKGERVKQGQHIGDIGASGRATGPHLHWSLKWRDARLDPLLFTGPMR